MSTKPGTVQVHQSIGEAMAREGGAFDAAVLGANVEYATALSYGKHAAP